MTVVPLKMVVVAVAAEVWASVGGGGNGDSGDINISSWR